MTLFALTVYGIFAALICRILPQKYRWIIMLIASCGFYSVRCLSGLPYILLTALTTYLAGLFMNRIQSHAAEETALRPDAKKEIRTKCRRHCNQAAGITLVFNLCLLGFFKYADSVLKLSGQSPLGLVLPLGISFYTFQAIGYLLDVSGGKIQAERNPARFALFISFFPQLLQGPIGRYDTLASQYREPENTSFQQALQALLLIFWGLLKKLVIADRALGFVGAVFDVPAATYGASMNIVGVLLYSLQQYCDFSGGIDLVIGIAELMGIHLPQNFRQPYFSVSLADFWRRWHITLGSWMRDYVFYPFALSKPLTALTKHIRKRNTVLARTLPAALGNLLVFFLVGLWHGATSNYILWGLYNGFILAFSSLMEPVYKKHELRQPSAMLHFFRILRTFIIVNIGWFFDRSQNGFDAFARIHSLIADWRPHEVSAAVLDSMQLPAHDRIVLVIGALIILFVSILREKGINIRHRLSTLPFPLRWLIFLSMILSVVIFGVWGSGYEEAAFLYYQF